MLGFTSPALDPRKLIAGASRLRAVKDWLTHIDTVPAASSGNLCGVIEK